MQEGRGSGLRSGMQQSWQARQTVGVSKMTGNVEKTRDREWEGATRLGCARIGFSLWPQVLAEVTRIWHLPHTVAQGAPITPQQHSLMPGRLNSEQAASSPFHRRANRGSGRHRDRKPAGRTQSGEDPGRARPPTIHPWGPSPYP